MGLTECISPAAKMLPPPTLVTSSCPPDDDDDDDRVSESKKNNKFYLYSQLMGACSQENDLPALLNGFFKDANPAQLIYNPI